MLTPQFGNPDNICVMSFLGGGLRSLNVLVCETTDLAGQPQMTLCLCIVVQCVVDLIPNILVVGLL